MSKLPHPTALPLGCSEQCSVDLSKHRNHLESWWDIRALAGDSDAGGLGCR